MSFRDSASLALSRLDALFDPFSAEAQSAPTQATRLIRVPLDAQDSVLVSIADLTEIFRVEAAEVLPIPEMTRCVTGICSWRGEMLWLVDFNQFVGYPSLFEQAQSYSPLTVLVIQNDLQAIGIVVSQVNDLELHDLQHLQPPAIGLFSPELLPLVRGTLPGSSDPVLDLQALIQSPLWQHPTQKHEHFPA